MNALPLLSEAQGGVLTLTLNRAAARNALSPELLLGTDIRIAAKHARFGWPEVQRAVLPFAGSMARLPRQVGHAAALQLLLTGLPINAAEALRIGLVNEVLPAADVLPRAQAIARQIASNGPLAVQAVKRTVMACSDLPLNAAFYIEDVAWAAVAASEDAQVGPRACIEKRAPVWRGR